MSDQDVKPISNVTGTFQALQLKPEQVPPDGNKAPETGKQVPEAEPARRPDLEALAAKLNVVSRSIGRDLRFKVNMDSGSSVIQVLDRETGEIIREIPPEEAEVSVSVRGDVQLRLYDELA